MGKEFFVVYKIKEVKSDTKEVSGALRPFTLKGFLCKRNSVKEQPKVVKTFFT